MSVTDQESVAVTTAHGVLVAYGKFVHQLGIGEAFARVPFPMKIVDHSPADKLTELLVHILAGGMHVVELERNAHPLVCDDAVAHAWGQQAFASASGVSDLLRAADAATVAAFKATVRDLLAPYRRRILREVSAGWLVVDLDLTAAVVSDHATTYEGADFGYLGEVNGLARGYQFARAQLVGRHDVLLLGGFLHPGRTISRQCLQEMVALVEAELGRPRRRVEVVAARLAQAEQALATLEAALAVRVAGSVYQRRRCKRLEAQREHKRAEVEALQARRDELAVANAANPHPRRIILRLDGGFGDADHLAWLYEEGYDFVARAHSHAVADGLRREEGVTWEKVSKNGFIAKSQRTTLGPCPYPMRLLACRRWWGAEKPERWAALIVPPDLAAAMWPARRVGVFYNGRQGIEATIKEGKGIFASRHLPTRHRDGIALYQDLVLLAQNLIRWFRRQFLGHTVLAAARVKELVRIGAHSRARVCMGHGVWTITFTGPGPWSGLTVRLREQVADQLAFPFFDDDNLVKEKP